jgi:hypothetical protein
MRLKQRNENIMVETARIIVVLKRYGPKTKIKHVRSEKVRCAWHVQETEGLNEKNRVSLMSPDQHICNRRDISQTGEQSWNRACSMVKPMIWRPTIWRRRRRRKRNTCRLCVSDWCVDIQLGSMRKAKNTQIIANYSLSSMREQQVPNADKPVEHCRITSLFLIFLFSWTTRLQARFAEAIMFSRNLWPTTARGQHLARRWYSCSINRLFLYRGADNSVARPGRK